MSDDFDDHLLEHVREAFGPSSKAQDAKAGADIDTLTLVLKHLKVLLLKFEGQAVPPELRALIQDTLRAIDSYSSGHAGPEVESETGTRAVIKKAVGEFQKLRFQEALDRSLRVMAKGSTRATKEERLREFLRSFYERAGRGGVK